MPSFSQLDVFPKYRDDVKVRTTFGAGVSIFAILVMFILFLSEFIDFLSVKVEDHLVIDNTNYEKLPINFNISFSRIPCSLISLDVTDPGGSQLNIHDQNIMKTSLDKDGNIIGNSQNIKAGGTMKEGKIIKEAQKHGMQVEGSHGSHGSQGSSSQHNENENENENEKDKCGDCYGAGVEGQCCNKCQDIQEAYHAKGWAISDLGRFEQCRSEGKDGSLEKEAMSRHEGCNLFGFVSVKRGSGNFHFAPGFSFSGSHSHLHDFGAFQSGSFDTSHYIHHLSFGNEIETINDANLKLALENILYNPLDSTNHSSSFDGQSIFQYYAKVVPTRYKNNENQIELTNQYSVTIHETKLKLKEGYGIPGVYFFYEFSPLMLDIRQHQTPFFHFLTQVCAIIGGIFTVTGLLDRIVHGTMKSLKMKQNLGKFG